MRRVLSLVLLLGAGALRLSAGSYAVSLPEEAGKVAKTDDLSAFRPLGLEVVRELRNLPGVLLVEMPESTAGLLQVRGYRVETLPRYRLQEISWSLDRENQRTLPLDGDTTRPYTGAGVRIFILDGEFFENPIEFGDRIAEARSYIRDGKGPFAECGRGTSHGTATASIAAGNDFGVAPGAELALIRIYDCQENINGAGYFSALDDIATWKKANPTSPAVVNMSFAGEIGGGVRPTEQKLLRLLEGLGVLLVDAAANYNRNACRYVPAKYSETITAGASDEEDRKAGFSNWGSCVDLFAPGNNILHRRGPGPDVWSGGGTSNSAPAIAGAIALMFEGLPHLKPSEVKALILANATRGALVGSLGTGSPNRLLYSGAVREEVTKHIARWSPSTKKLTVEVSVSLNGAPTPLASARLYRGRAVNGRCQGAAFATVMLKNGNGTVTKALQQAPAFICIETRTKSVTDRAVQSL